MTEVKPPPPAEEEPLSLDATPEQEEERRQKLAKDRKLAGENMSLRQKLREERAARARLLSEPAEAITFKIASALHDALVDIEIVPGKRKEVVDAVRPFLAIDDNGNVVVEDDETGETRPLTPEAVRLLISPKLIQSRASGGSGGQAPREIKFATPKLSDEELIRRGVASQAFYEANKAKIEAALRKVKT